MSFKIKVTETKVVNSCNDCPLRWQLDRMSVINRCRVSNDKPIENVKGIPNWCKLNDSEGILHIEK